MIHIFIGTKAQYVKTAPVILELNRRGTPYNLIDSGQHAHLSKNYRSYFGIKEPDVLLTERTSDIKSVGGMIAWFFSFLMEIIFKPGKLFTKLFKNQPGICLVHGDTPTTLLSVLACNRVGVKAVHLESGLRSFKLFQPFPEEIIRIITMRISDYLFAPSQWAFDNLKKMGLEKKSHLISGNTNIDALRFIKGKSSTQKPDGKYIIFSIHRVETILNKARLGKIVNLAKHLSSAYAVIFCTHPPTKKQLIRFNYFDSLAKQPNITLIDLLPYPDFIATISQAEFIVTDGGSVQEESYYLNTPCLLMRNVTERMEGVGQNVCISDFDQKKIDHFINHLDDFRKSDYRDSAVSPSFDIVEQILKLKEK